MPDRIRTVRWTLAAIAIAAVAVLVGAAPVAAFPPLPTPTTTVIEVPVGGDRVDDNLEIGPAITLQLFDGGSAGPTSPVGEPWATCVPDEDGSCWFRVPDTGSGGANAGRRFWVARTGTVPAGWFANDAFAIGAEPFVSTRPYTFRTLGMQGNRRIASGFDFMDAFGVDAEDPTASHGAWQVSRDNPPFPSECRRDIAFIIDLSFDDTSDDGPAPTDFEQMQDAVAGFVTALEGTPTRVALFPMARTAPGTRPQNTNLPPTSVATRAGANAVRTHLQRFGDEPGVNWDAGLAQIAQDPTPFDLAVLITRRPPTNFGPGLDPENNITRFAEMEAAIFSANALKAKGTPIVAIDLLRDLRSNPDLHPLRAVSGLEEDADFFEPTLVSDLDPFVQQHLLGPCRGELTVVKEVVPNTAAPSSITGAVAGAGFAFVATTAPDPGEVSPGSATTGADGTVVFESLPTADTLTITETRRPGYTLHQRAGDNANCRRIGIDPPSPVPISNAADGFTFDLAIFARGVTCTLYNRAPPEGFVGADARGPYTVDEGSTLTLDGSNSTAPAGATFAWDVDDDGQFDDATGPNPTLTPAQLHALGLGDGPSGPLTVTLQVTDGTDLGTDTAELTVTNTPPIAQFVTVPSAIVANAPATLTFGADDPAASDDAAGFTYSIGWGDGTPVQSVAAGTTVDVEHTWTTDGTFTIGVTATDKDGGTSTPVTATVSALPPVIAGAGGPYTVEEGNSLVLDATGTAAGPTATFTWDVDGDRAFDDASGPNPTLTPAQLDALALADGPAGPVTVSVEVSDGIATSTDTTTLTIDNVAPTTTVTAPIPIVAGTPAAFTFGATDASTADQAAGFTFAIDWGDGAPAQSVIGPAGTDVQHTYTSTGPLTVSVTATDKDGGTSDAATASVTVGVGSQDLVADAGGPYAIAEGDDLTLDATASVAGPTAVYAWDLDADGTFDDATGPNPTLTPAQLDALGLADGPTGPVTFTVQVTEGSIVATDTAEYTITNVAPVATVELPDTIVAGVPVTIKVGAIDPSPADAAAQFEYRVDWEGDGIIDLVVTGPADPPVTHTYASAGAIGVTVIAVDDEGAASTPTVTSVTVASATITDTPDDPTDTETNDFFSALPFTGTDARGYVAFALVLVTTGLTLIATSLRRGRRAITKGVTQ